MSNIHIVKYNGGYKYEWDNLVKKSKNSHFFFLRDYIEYHKDRFKEHSLIIKEGDKVVGILPGNIENGIFYSHQGLTFGGLIVADKIRAANCEVIVSKLIRYLKDMGVFKLVYKKMPYIYNQLSFEEDVYYLIKSGANIYYSEIGQVITYDNFKISSRRKDKIREAQQHNIKVKEEKCYSAYWAILEENLKKHSAVPTHTLNEIEYLAYKFPKNIKLYCAIKGTELLCGTVVYINKNLAHTQYISSTANAHKYNALEYLLNEVVEEFKNKKFFSFGISTEDNGNKLNKGLAFFKEGFGARGVLNLTYSLTLHE